MYSGNFGKLSIKKQQIIGDQLTVRSPNVSLQRPNIKTSATPNVFYGFAGKHENTLKIFQKVTAYEKRKDLAALKNKQENAKNAIIAKEIFTNLNKDEIIEDFFKDLKENRLEWQKKLKKKFSTTKIRRKIKEGSYPNFSVDEENLSTLPRLVWKGKTKKLEKYLNDKIKHGKINRQDDYGRTALHFAASWGCTQTMEALLKITGINLNIKDAHDKTPLFKAAEINSVECVRLLIENGANVKITCRDGRNVLDYLIQEYGDESLPVVRYLLSTGKFDDEPKKNGRTLTSLHKLCLVQKHVSLEETTEVLIDHGMDINAVEGKGRTPLMLAIMCKRNDVTRSLFRRFADLNIYDDKFKTAVDYAVKGSYALKLLSGCRGNNVRVLFHGTNDERGNTNKPGHTTEDGKATDSKISL